MKYYILNSIDRVMQYSKKLDAESILYNKSWEVFSDDGIKRIFIFRANGELLSSTNGKVQKGKWELLPNSSMLIDINDNSYLLKPQFVDNQFLSLHLDGHSDSLILIDEAVKEHLSLVSLSNITDYLTQKYIEEKKNAPTEKEENDLENDSPKGQELIANPADNAVSDESQYNPLFVVVVIAAIILFVIVIYCCFHDFIS